MRKVNYMTVDTEGGEINFLSHFPFDQFVIDVIQVEIRCVHGVGCTDGATATTVMAKYGYVLLENMSLTFLARHIPFCGHIIYNIFIKYKIKYTRSSLED